MKLIKLTDEHYIIVDDLEIKEGDWVLYNNSYIATVLGFPTDGGGGLKIQVVGDNAKIKTDFSSCKKITHSTQPLKSLKIDSYIANIRYVSWGDIKYLPFQEIKELIGEVDVEKRAQEYAIKTKSPNREAHRQGFIAGYYEAIEDNKEKKYTNEDMLTIRNQLVTMLPVGDVNAWDMIQAVSKYTKWLDEYVESIHQSPTSWDVEFDSQGKLKLKK